MDEQYDVVIVLASLKVCRLFKLCKRVEYEG